MAQYYVYIMASSNRTLYTGVTNDIRRRVYEHKFRLVPGFTSKYFINRLVYFDDTGDVYGALTFEKRIKGWSRAKKIALIEERNPDWIGLSQQWGE
ncbi:MAG: GIY-YIG nuclease family protein [Chloroflexi bacterium]|nr:GIY-YIG nuclease family protein [Chloroflexota bacterium]